MPGRQELPSTLQRSAKKAQQTWIKAHDGAVDEYGEGARAHRTAFTTLKRTFQKVGDHWEAKSSPGPSDPQATQRGVAARQRPKATYGGVDVLGQTRDQLVDQARKAGVHGYSHMTKAELGRAIDQANQRTTRQSRS
jgi:hypothetical protein